MDLLIFQLFEYLPIWVAHAIAGGISGAIGFVIIKIRVVGLIFVIATMSLYQIYGVRYLEASLFRGSFINSTGKLPQKIDEITSLDSIHFNGPSLVRNHTINLSDAAVGDINFDKLKQNLTQQILLRGDCSWLIILNKKGWLSSVTYNFKTESREFSLRFDPEICSAINENQT